MLTFGEAARQMKIDDATMARHIDALLCDFVDGNRILFEGDLPTESALSEAGRRLFREGRLRRDEPCRGWSWSVTTAAKRSGGRT
jgi:hypothetical protein